MENSKSIYREKPISKSKSSASLYKENNQNSLSKKINKKARFNALSLKLDESSESSLSLSKTKINRENHPKHKNAKI